MSPEEFTLPSPEYIGLLALGLILPVVLVPARYRMRVALIEMGVLMALGKLQDLGEIAMLAKVASGVPLVLVGAAAVMHPGRRRRSGILNWLSIVVAITACCFVAGAGDWTKAFGFRAQMATATIAMLLVSRTIVDHRTLREVLLGIFLGGGIGVFLSLSCLIVDPVAAYAGGLGRLEPYGCNPVQIGVLYLVTAVLGMYFSIEPHRAVPHWLTVAVTALSMAGAALTVSRMAILGIAIASLPALAKSARRPLVAATIVVAVAFVVPKLFGSLAGANLDHINASRDRHRLDYMKEVLNEVRSRPFFGLLYAEGVHAHDAEYNAHNAYIEILFLGGATIAVPSVLLLGVAARGALLSCRRPRGVLRGRRRLEYTRCRELHPVASCH